MVNCEGVGVGCRVASGGLILSLGLRPLHTFTQESPRVITPQDNQPFAPHEEPHAEIGPFPASSLTGEPPAREWTVDGYLPRGSVTGIFGPGGVGKSLLAQQLGVSLSTGQPWLGLKTHQQSVIGYFCEDDKNELWRRQNAINAGMGVRPDDLGEFYMQSRAGMENILMKFANGIGTRTDFFRQIEQDIRSLEAKTLILDNAAQMFGGNENDRREVTQFVNALHGLINDGDLTILLLGHPPKASATGMQHDYSGSTGWDACFRSRLFFGRPEKQDDETDEDMNYRVLTKKKANYSTIGDAVKVKWEHGFFRVTQEVIGFVEKLDLSVKQKEANTEFCKMLEVLNKRGQEVSHSPTSQNYAPKVIRGMPRIKDGISYKMLCKAVDILVDAGTIEINHDFGKRNGRRAYGLKLVKEEK